MARIIIVSLALLVSTLAVSAESRASLDADQRQAVWAALQDVLPPDVLAAIAPAIGVQVNAARIAIGEEPDVEIDPEVVIKPPVPVTVRGASLKHVPLRRLPAVNVQKLLAEDAQMETLNKSLRFGVGRNLLADMHDGAWLAMDGGWLWVLDVQSDGALALRVHALNMFLPRGATLIAYAHDAQGAVQGVIGPFEEAGPFDDGDIWLPTVHSQRVRFECWVPGELAQPPAGNLFALDRLQHVYRDPMDEMRAQVGDMEAGIDKAGEIGGAGSEGGIAGSPIDGGGCHNQVACHPDWLNTANAVGGIGIINNDSIFCSGQLLRTLVNDRTPYYLTANHCLSSNEEARTCEVYWRYQSPTCGGVAPFIGSVPQSNVCTLVATDPGTDFTLLMIEGPLPSNARWADWDNVDAANGTDVVCIHHPQGHQKRISFGDKQTPPSCGGASHIRVDWTDGVTQPGSSGSGVFRADNGKLIGQLHCGSSACGNVTNDSFGAFWVTHGLISDLLAAGSDDGFEDNETCGNAALVSEGVYNNRVVKSLDTDWYRIQVPAGRVLTVRTNFKHAWGDIDMRLYATCGGPALDSSLSVSNSEHVTYVNSSGSTQTVRVRVFIVGDVRNKYKLTVDISNP